MPKTDLSLSFTLSESEFLRAHRGHLRRSLFTGWNLMLITLALGLASLQAQVLGGAAWAGAFFTGLWAIVLGLMAFAYFQLPARLYRRSPRLSDELRLDFDADGVAITSPHGKESRPWSDIMRSQETSEFVYLYPRGQGLPILVPKRIFESADAARNFREYVSRRILGL